MNELLKVNEVARRLGIGRTTAYKLIRTGVLPCVRIGRAVRVDQAVLGGWIAGLAAAVGSQQEAHDDAR
jgi:excisionase family DNA binding protein